HPLGENESFFRAWIRWLKIFFKNLFAQNLTLIKSSHILLIPNIIFKANKITAMAFVSGLNKRLKNKSKSFLIKIKAKSFMIDFLIKINEKFDFLVKIHFCGIY